MSPGEATDILAGQAAVRITAWDEQLDQGLARAEAKLRRWGERMSRLGMGMMQTGAIMGAALAYPTYQFGQFEQAMVEVQKVTDRGLAGKLEEDILSLSTEVPKAATKLAEMTAQAARFGIEGRDAIMNFTETVSKMDVATEMAARESAEALAKIRRVTGTTEDQFSNLGSAINALSNEFGANAQQIVRTANKAGASLAQLGLRQTEILGLSAALDEVAPSMRRAGTRMRRLGEELRKTSTLREVARIFGTTEQEMLQMAQNAPLQLILKLSNAFAEGGSEAARLQEALTSGVTPALSKLGQNMDRVEQALGRSAEAFRENTSLEREFRMATETLWNQWTLAWNKIQKVATGIGETLKPQLATMGAEVAGAAQAVGNFVQNNELLVQGMLSATTALLGMGAAMFTLGKAASAAATALAWFNSTAGIWVGAGVAAATVLWYLVDALHTSESELKAQQQQLKQTARQYRELAQQENLTAAETKTLADATVTLRNAYPKLASEIDGTAESVKTLRQETELLNREQKKATEGTIGQAMKQQKKRRRELEQAETQTMTAIEQLEDRLGKGTISLRDIPITRESAWLMDWILGREPWKKLQKLRQRLKEIRQELDNAPESRFEKLVKRARKTAEGPTGPLGFELVQPTKERGNMQALTKMMNKYNQRIEEQRIKLMQDRYKREKAMIRLRYARERDEIEMTLKQGTRARQRALEKWSEARRLALEKVEQRRKRARREEEKAEQRRFEQFRSRQRQRLERQKIRANNEGVKQENKLLELRKRQRMERLKELELTEKQRDALEKMINQEFRLRKQQQRREGETGFRETSARGVFRLTSPWGLGKGRGPMSRIERYVERMVEEQEKTNRQLQESNAWSG